MISAYRSLWLATLALLLVGAAPSEQEDWLRRGNTAFAQAAAAPDKDDAKRLYEDALRSYGEAEERSTDPGLVAFNKAAVLYRLGRFREAELCYRRCLEDGEVPGPRRARALYDLGTSLLHVKEGKDALILQNAIRCLQLCRRQTDDPGLRSQAAHNLELARLLWIKAKANPADPNQKSEAEEDPRKRKQGEDEPMPQAGDGIDKHGNPIGKGQVLQQDASKGQQKAIETNQTLPGKGRIEVLPDSDELTPLDAQDTAEHLERAARRILDEHRKQLRQTPRDVPNVKDW
jgi:tetratricopeptide (TPR) repeat protein